MKIGTWNVNGIRARESQLLEWVARDAPDVVCLQEIKAGVSQLSLALTQLPDYASAWHGSGGYSGVSLHLARRSFEGEPVFSHPAFDHETRIVEARAAYRGRPLRVASTYVPNGGKDFPAKMRFLRALDAHVASREANEEWVVCGDLNVARAEVDVHPSQRDPACIGQLPEERALIESILARGLVDLGRALDPDNARLFTWWPYWRQARARNLGWRLDYVLASPLLAAAARSCSVLRDVGTSDHAPVMVELDDAELARSFLDA